MKKARREKKRGMHTDVCKMKGKKRMLTVKWDKDVIFYGRTAHFFFYFFSRESLKATVVLFFLSFFLYKNNCAHGALLKGKEEKKLELNESVTRKEKKEEEEIRVTFQWCNRLKSSRSMFVKGRRKKREWNVNYCFCQSPWLNELFNNW